MFWWMNHPPNSDGGETKGAPTKEGRNWDKEAGAMIWLIHCNIDIYDMVTITLTTCTSRWMREWERLRNRWREGTEICWRKKLQLSEDYRAILLQVGEFLQTVSCHLIVVVALTCQGPQPLLWYTIQLGNLTRLLNLLIPGDHHEPLQGKDGQAHNRLNPYKTNICHTMHCTVS